MTGNGFELICEVEPATRPDLMRASSDRRDEQGRSRVPDPDNHIGRATASSIAVAHEVAQMGGRAIACLNARDRNVLGFRRDLHTAAAYGVDEFLFVYGDRPESGKRSDDLTVRLMLREARAFATRSDKGTSLRLGVAAAIGPFALWKKEAEFCFAQVSFAVDELLEWRASVDFIGPMYAGVLVVASAPMARKLSSEHPQLAVPSHVIELVERDRTAGVKLACDLVAAIRASGAFDGVHLIPVSRYREIAASLEEQP